MPWGHSFQKHLVHNTLCLAVIQTMEAQSQEGLLLLRARQKHHGVRVSAKMSLMVDLTASAWASPCWVLLQHPVLAHVPNFWAKLWKCVFRGCFIRQGNGNHLSLRVQHFTIKTCTNHIIVFMLVSGHGSLREHFHYSILPFFFFSASLLLLSVLKIQEEIFWLGSAQHRTFPSCKDHNWGCKRPFQKPVNECCKDAKIHRSLISMLVFGWAFVPLKKLCDLLQSRGGWNTFIEHKLCAQSCR